MSVMGMMLSNSSIVSAGGNPVAGYYAWYRADRDTYTDTGLTTPATVNGALVAGWKDASANAFHLTQSTSGKRPTLKTNAINGYPSLLFDPTHPDGLFTSVGTSDIVNIFAVVKFSNASPSAIATVITSLGASHFRQVHRTSGGNLTMYSGTNLNDGATGTGWLYLSADWTGGTGNLYKNASNVATGSAGTGAANGWSIGTGTQFIEGMEGEVAEMILYTSVLGSTDRATNEAYFAARYGL